MLSRHSLVWKMNAASLAILTTVLATLGYATNRVYERDALALAHDVSRVNSETILHSIDKFMMTRDTAGIRDLIVRLSSDNPVYRDIRLISHAGGVVASREGLGPMILGMDSWPCGGCHSLRDPRRGLGASQYDKVHQSADGERTVSVITPIYNEPRCSSSECHSDPTGAPVLGVLQADFSLGRVDGLIAERNLHTVLALLVAVLLSTATTWLLIRRLVGRRLTALRDGLNRVANRDFGFRFRDGRQDEFAQLAASFDDMTSELGSALSELRNTRDYLQGIVESSADIIITVDPTGSIRTFNTGAEEVLGYDREEVIGKSVEMLFAEPSERDAAIAELQHSDHVVNYETHFLARDGDVKDVILTLSRLRTPDGVAIGTFGISKDVTLEKRLQRELLLKEKLAAIGRAVTGIQHTLKNMLSSLKGGSYLVETGLRDHERPLLVEGWSMVKEGLTRITLFSSRMLDYVREWDPVVERVDLSHLVTCVYEVNRQRAREKGIVFRVESAQRLPKALCDPRLLQSVLMDLLSNAFDACEWKDYSEPERPEVVIRVGCGGDDEDRMEIVVEDNGEGISGDIQKHIFTPFFTTRKTRGTGVGLTLASRIIQSHGGAIEVVSEPTRGSTFRVSLPVGGPPQKEALHG
jgi:PAS domain S-box-containing protein